jgi:hypothetical protein
MPIIITVGDSKKLLDDIKKLIDEAKKHPDKEGVIKSWDYDGDGDFFHVKDEWPQGMWLHPAVKAGTLELTPIAPEGKTLTLATLGHRQGQFAGMTLTHFSSVISSACLIP